MILAGPGEEGLIVGDSFAIFDGATVSGDGGDDVIDTGPGGSGFVVYADHASFGDAFGAGNDVVISRGSTAELIVGDSSAFWTSAPTDAGNDTISAGAGDDTVLGDNTLDDATSFGIVGGNDDLDGGDGNDTLRAGPANDTLDGGPGDPDDCDGEGGRDSAKRCEVLAGVP